MKRHDLRMILGCTLPLLLVFLVPLLGLSGNVGTFLFVVLMFACHLLMMRGHGGSGDGREGHHGHH